MFLTTYNLVYVFYVLVRVLVGFGTPSYSAMNVRSLHQHCGRLAVLPLNQSLCVSGMCVTQQRVARGRIG